MGTRSITVIKDETTKLVTLYKQYDGYPTGWGQELLDFLKEFTIVNGYSSHMEAGSHANGAGCLAAQLIANFKTDIGGLYIEAYNIKRGHYGEAYQYVITINDGQIYMSIDDIYAKKTILKKTLISKVNSDLLESIESEV
jgi:hypothetical protein